MEKIKVAVASSSGKKVDIHFGQAKEYLIYEIDLSEDTISADGSLKLEISIPDTVKTGGCMGQNNEILEQIGRQLRGCGYVLVQKIGPKPQKILMRYGVNFLETEDDIDVSLQKLKQYLRRR